MIDMDVFFELLGGSLFPVTVDFFDTIRDIKEKVGLCFGIPVSEQTYIFNGQVLQDHLDIGTCQISPGSTILILTSDQAANLAAAGLPMPNLPAEAVNLVAEAFPPPTQVLSMPNMPVVADYAANPVAPELPPMMEELTMPYLPAQPQQTIIPGNAPPAMQELHWSPTVVPSNDLLRMPVQQTPTTFLGYASPSMQELQWPPARLQGYDFLGMPIMQVSQTPTSIPGNAPPPMQELHWSPTIVPSNDLLRMPVQQTPTTFPGYASPSMQELQWQPPRFQGYDLLGMPIMQEFPRPPQPRRVHMLQRRIQRPQPPPPPPPPKPPSPKLNSKELEEEVSSGKDSPVQLPSKKIHLDVKIPASKDRVPVLMDVNDTVLKLKEEIQRKEDMQAVVTDRILLRLHTTRVELLDHQLLKDCGVSDNPEIDVFIKPSLSVVADVDGSNSGDGGGSDKLKVVVLPMKTNDEKIAIEVNAEDNVEVLKEELEKLQQQLGFRLPKHDRYFFIHKQEVMYENKSFQWHRVKQGDNIHTFDGYVDEP